MRFEKGPQSAGHQEQIKMKRSKAGTLCLIILSGLALAACGVKGPLQAPPGDAGSSQTVQEPPQKNFPG